MSSILQAVSNLILTKDDESYIEGGAQPFVKIIDGKLSFVNRIRINTKKPFRVLSILGKARMGKSTLFNTIISKLTKKNVKVFQTQDNDEHCTRGINGFFLKEHNLLLLDCQGLSLENSSHDPTLLLLVYLISDVIVFNERMMLQNEALKLMEPICTFMTYIDTETIKKPTLVFRISDADLVKDTQHNLKKVLSPYEDQYQSIRESITHLFQDPIELVKTNPLERSHKQFLEKNDYVSLLKDDYVNFDEAVSKIISFLGNGQNPEDWIQKVPIIIEQINNNEKINYKKLDIVGLTQKNEVQEWILSLPPILDISVNHTQKMYEDNVEPRKAEKKNILTSFTKKFKNLPKSMKESEYNKLEERLNAPIKIATLKAEHDAQSFLRSDVILAHKHEFNSVTSIEQSFTSRNDDFWNHYFQNQTRLISVCKTHDIYAPVAKEYSDWVSEIKNVFFKEIDKIKEEEAKEVIKIDTTLDTLIESFIDSKLSMIENMKDIKFVKKTTVSYIDEWKNECIQQMTNTIKIMADYRYVNSSIILNNNGKYCMKVNIEKKSANRYINYDLINPLFEKYNSQVQNEFSDYFLEAIKEKKLELLENKVIKDKSPSLDIISVNDDIEWVFEGAEYCCFMTKDTHIKNIGPIHKKVIDKMIKKGYITESYNFTLKKQIRWITDSAKFEESNHLYNTYKSSSYRFDRSNPYNINVINSSIGHLYCHYYDKEFLLTPNKDTMFEDIDDIKVEPIPELIVNNTTKTTTTKVEQKSNIDSAEDKRLEQIAHSWAYDS